MYSLAFQVRDYECDMQGIVNNAVYQHYFEHTRHEFLKQHTCHFAELTQAGIHLVIYRAEIDYLLPLTSGDLFTVELLLERVSKTRCLFKQTIHCNGKTYTKGQFFVTAINAAKRPINLDVIEINALLLNKV
ncbi:MAG: thioesterase family protein [Tatlockia sp.]